MISIHAPLAGSDVLYISCVLSFINFNPRSPRGERQNSIKDSVKALIISIHAPLAGSDSSPSTNPNDYIDFNPRSPRGERPDEPSFRCHYADFNPRSPRGERPGLPSIRERSCLISIHAPLAGSDFGFRGAYSDNK